MKTFIHAKRLSDGKEVKKVVNADLPTMLVEAEKQGAKVISAKQLPETPIHKSKIALFFSGFALQRVSPGLLKIDLTGRGQALKFAETACTMSRIWELQGIDYVTTDFHAWVFKKSN